VAARALGAPWSATFGIALSLALHLALYAVLRWVVTAPTIDIELVLPQTVEFGLTEEMPAAALPVAPPPAPAEPAVPPPAPEPAPEPAPASEPERPEKKVPPRDAGAEDLTPSPDAATLDAPDASVADETPPSAQLAEPDAGSLSTPDAGAPLLAAYAPPGAQIALRLHMGNVRDSPLAEDVRRFLGAVPDWQLLLDGSGIDPLRDLERVFLASPNLQRSSLVVAGQYLGDASLPKRAVDSLAKARGRPARWRMRDGIAVAPWHDLDETDRVVALIAPQQFAITRPDDLPRILAVAHALSERAERESGHAPSDPMQALLALGADEAFSLSVEGARNFVQGNMRGVPERLEAVVHAPNAESGIIAVHMSGVFETPEAASEAARYWESVRRRYATHPLVAIVGMSSPLKKATLEANDTRVALQTEVTVAQARVVLGFLRDALGPATTRMPTAGTPRPGGAPGTGPAPKPAPDGVKPGASDAPPRRASPKSSGVPRPKRGGTIPPRRADR
jgi:hypothetical protein